MRRTKPYGYSLFNLDAMATVCQILSTREENLWTFQLPDGRGIKKAMEFMFPYIADKKKWPHTPDVMYFDQWPVRHPSLLFAGLALEQPKYLALWRTLDPDPTVDETIRNYPIRQPVLWLRPFERIIKNSTQRRRDAETQRRKRRFSLRLCASASLRLCVDFLLRTAASTRTE